MTDLIWSFSPWLVFLLASRVLIFGSILVGRPFTESYARSTTPPEVWHTRELREVNRRISAAWGLGFVVGDVSLALAGSVNARQQAQVRAAHPDPIPHPLTQKER